MRPHPLWRRRPARGVAVALLLSPPLVLLHHLLPNHAPSPPPPPTPPFAADSDDRIAGSSDTGWPYLEHLKAAVRLITKANVSSAPGKGYDAAWVDIDRAAHVAKLLKGEGDPKHAAGAAGAGAGAGAGAAAGAAGAAAAADGGPDFDGMLSSPAARAAETARAALVATYRRDDPVDCAVDAQGGHWPLREWVSPAAAAVYDKGGFWPLARGTSVLVRRALELQLLLDDVAACENHVFGLELVGEAGGCGVPSHLNLELLLTRLPNLAHLSLRYGALERGVAPVPGFSAPLPEEAAGAVTADGEAPKAITAEPSPPGVVYGMLPSDLTSLCRCLGAASCTLVSLTLARCALDDALVLQLAQALTGNATLAALDLSHNRIGGGGAATLARLLLCGTGDARDGPAGAPLHGNKMGAPLTSLCLANNRCDARGAAALAAAVAAKPAFSLLDVRLNPLGDAGAAALLRCAAGHPSLAALNLAGTALGEGAAAAAAAAVATPGTRLRALDLSANKLGAGDVAALADAVVAARASRASALCKLDVRPAEAPVAMEDALRENAAEAEGSPASGVYAAQLRKE